MYRKIDSSLSGLNMSYVLNPKLLILELILIGVSIEQNFFCLYLKINLTNHGTKQKQKSRDGNRQSDW